MNRQAKILVVDDMPMNVKFLKDLLVVKGYTVVTTSSGHEALVQVAKERPDLVLLDVMMPDLNGYEVCRKIRDNPETAFLPVVMVTSLDAMEERIKGIEAGADDFLTKPINQMELLARVRSLIRIRVLHDQVQSQAAELADWNKTLERRVEEQLAQLTSLLEVSRLLTSSLEVDELLQLILVKVSGLMEADISNLLILDPTTHDLVYRVPVSPAGEALKDVRLKASEGIAGWVVKERSPVLMNQIENDPRAQITLDKLGVKTARSILTVPLQDRDRIIGAIEVLNTAKEKQFNQRDVDLLTAFAAHASVALRNAQLVSNIKEENRSLQGALHERYGTIIGESPQMEHIVGIAQKAAKAPATILLLGESGVGKEIFARSIHGWSPRAHKPLLAVNCVALSDHLLESELFGHEKGAFTGAHQQKKGLFESANGGTVFLDEIGDMKQDLQAKLLRVLQEHTFKRVGGTQTIQVDIRIIAATNQDLETAVQAGRFRQDLFFRLNVIALTLPPLRDRPEDILPLARLFVHRFCRDLHRAPMTIVPDGEILLQQYAWPGNVRELENVIERAVVLATSSEIGSEDLVFGSAGNVGGTSVPTDIPLGLSFQESLETHKEAIVREALDKAQGRRGKAAELLKIHPTYLSRLLKQFGIN